LTFYNAATNEDFDDLEDDDDAQAELERQARGQFKIKILFF